MPLTAQGYKMDFPVTDDISKEEHIAGILSIILR